MLGGSTMKKESHTHFVSTLLSVSLASIIGQRIHSAVDMLTISHIHLISYKLVFL